MKGNNLDCIELKKAGLQISDQLTAGIAYWDKDLICRFLNKASEELFGKSREEIIGKASLKELLGEQLFRKNYPFVIKALSGIKQEFEREIMLPNGKIRHSLITYIPDIQNAEVKGFIVHNADIGYIKKLDSMLLESRREMLRNVIESRENERVDIAYTLRESVNQTLAYCKMILQLKNKELPDHELGKDIAQTIQQAIDELNKLSTQLVPTAISDFGFIVGTENYLENIKAKYPVQILFECNDKAIEQIHLEDKLSIFRIIQHLVILLTDNSSCRFIGIRINYFSSNILIRISYHDKEFVFDKESKEFKSVEYRVEYYDGIMEYLKNDTESIFQINLRAIPHNGVFRIGN